MCGQAPVPEWLQTDWILGQFGAGRSEAMAACVRFAHEGARLPSMWAQLQGQIYLGSESFMKQMKGLIEDRPNIEEVPRRQRRPLTRPLTAYAANDPRDEAKARAYLSGQYSLAEIARHFGVHYTTVSRVVKSHEAARMR